MGCILAFEWSCLRAQQPCGSLGQRIAPEFPSPPSPALKPYFQTLRDSCVLSSGHGVYFLSLTFSRGLLPQRQPLCLFPYSAATVVSLKPNWPGPKPIPDALSCHPRPIRHRTRAASNSHHVPNYVPSCLSPSTRNTPFYQACPSRFLSLSLPWPPFSTLGEMLFYSTRNALSRRQSLPASPHPQHTCTHFTHTQPPQLSCVSPFSVMAESNSCLYPEHLMGDGWMNKKYEWRERVSEKDLGWIPCSEWVSHHSELEVLCKNWGALREQLLGSYRYWGTPRWIFSWLTWKPAWDTCMK